MGEKLGRSNHKCYPFLWVVVFIYSLILIIVINVASSRMQYPHPQAILSLGGHHDREKLAAKLASQNPNLIIWVSSGSDNKITNKIFQNAGIPADRYFLDNRATDTVTNFTTLVEDFKQHHIKHLYLITSNYHIARARAISTVILGSQGIAFTPISVVDSTKPHQNESIGKILRDVGRSILWIFSGHTGASLKDI